MSRGFVPRHAWDAVIETRDECVYLRRVSPRARRFEIKNHPEVSLKLRCALVVLENGAPVSWLETVSAIAARVLQEEIGWKVSVVPDLIYAVNERGRGETNVQLTLCEEEFADNVPELHECMHPYQREGVAFAMLLHASGQRGCGIFDEMGLGKTLQALGFMKNLMRRSPTPVHTLIVCPGYLRGNWRSEIVKWDIFPESAIQTMKKLADRPTVVGHTIVLASYRWMRENAAHLEEFTLCVFDEAHLLKNAHHTRDRDCSLRYLAARQLASRVEFSLFLTGTPTPNCPKELYSLLTLVGAVEMKYAEFAFRYCKRYFSRLFFGWCDEQVSAKEELKALQSMHFIRRLAADHLHGLPGEMRSFVTLPLQGGIAKLKKLAKERERLLQKLNDSSLTDHEREGTSKKVQFNRTAQLVASAQAKNKSFKQYFMQYLKDHPPRSDGTRAPFIVFAYHELTLLALQTLFQELEIIPGLVYGKTPKNEAEDIIQDFQNNKVEVLILSLAMSAGLNLQNSNVAFFAEVAWSPGVLSQAEKRIHRQGSAHDRVHYVYLFGERPAICEEVYKKCQRKKRNIDQSLQKDSKKARTE